ncbi:hypothetical protein MLD38_007216 [Melastoma candidum]|uniref:Uncharacterized protein n=1 Tax=Melastoma candidum TaxID=119954 RepID=A0ACB9RUM7_9MYRT|nr:hypothetical protein MLD38_007216 [Melastoma candidum]
MRMRVYGPMVLRPATPQSTTTSASSSSWLSQQLGAMGQERMKWVQKNYMIYDYCTDTKRFPQRLPPNQRQWQGIEEWLLFFLVNLG